MERIANAPAEDRKSATKIRNRADLRMGALGSGSDYTAFLDHLGIASLNLGYGGEDGGGIYHSIYDDFYWYTHFADTDFRYGRALAQTVGMAVMRLAGRGPVAVRFHRLHRHRSEVRRRVEKLWKTKSDEINERNRELEEGVYVAIADPRKTLVPPKAEEVAPFLNFAPLRNGLEKLQRSSAALR